MKKKELLFIYPYMMIGGSTTSLLSVLNSIDYNCYNVDILFYEKTGELIDYLPSQVRILPYACKYTSTKKLHLRKLFSPVSCVNAVKGRILSRRENNPWIADQFGSRDNVRYCVAQKKEYDIAFSYLEFWPMYYLAEKVTARRKIAWIHTDYEKLGLLRKYEDKTLKKLDRIVLISKECRDIFERCFPKWKYKTEVVENFPSVQMIKKQADEKTAFSVAKGRVNLITVCRIDFMSKGLDRAVNVIENLVQNGYESKFHWYIVGQGSDYTALEQLIIEKNLSSTITLLGAKNNPFPYEKKCDIFFLPSYFEGKPVSVTEAQILGLVPVVTNYSSAKEQIVNGIDGLIVNNNEEDILAGLKYLIEQPKELQRLKEGLLNKELQFVGEKQFQKLLI